MIRGSHQGRRVTTRARILAVIGVTVSLLFTTTAGATAATHTSSAASVRPTLPADCDPNMTLQIGLSNWAVRHWMHCVTGHNVLADVMVCQIAACGPGPGISQQDRMKAVMQTINNSHPNGGGPSCQVARDSYKWCYAGRGNAWKLTGLKWIDPQGRTGWVGPNYEGSGDGPGSDGVFAWIKHQWTGHVYVRRCTIIGAAESIGTAGVAIVTSGGTDGPVVAAVLGAALKGCIVGFLTYFWDAT